MHIGSGVRLPETTWIVVSHCNLISIGDNCRFGPQCLILAHDAQMDEFLDASRVGRVVVHHSSHIGAHGDSAGRRDRSTHHRMGEIGCLKIFAS
jgi:hypothetical protein